MLPLLLSSAPKHQLNHVHEGTDEKKKKKTCRECKSKTVTLAFRNPPLNTSKNCCNQPLKTLTLNIHVSAVQTGCKWLNRGQACCGVGSSGEKTRRDSLLANVVVFNAWYVHSCRGLKCDDWNVHIRGHRRCFLQQSTQAPSRSLFSSLERKAQETSREQYEGTTVKQDNGSPGSTGTATTKLRAPNFDNSKGTPVAEIGRATR